MTPQPADTAAIPGPCLSSVVSILRRAEAAGKQSGFVELFKRRAEAEAQCSDRLRHKGEPLRALEGMPVAWKDIFSIEGHANHAGLDRPVGPPASHDAELVRRASAAGAITVGATAMTEIGYSLLGQNMVNGTLANPNRTNGEVRLAGGSSTGSAIAVAKGLVPVAIGTDSGGSCRLPAAWCGTVGFKPSRRALSLDGCLPFSPSFDTAGILASTVGQVRSVFDALRATATVEPAEPAFVTVDISELPEISAEVRRSFDEAASAIGSAHSLLRVRLRTLEAVIAGTVADLIPVAEGSVVWSRYRKAGGSYSHTHLAKALARDFRRSKSLDVVEAFRQRDELVAGFAKEMHGRILILPCCAIGPPTQNETHGKANYLKVYASASKFLKPFNVLDAPSICLPVTGVGAGQCSVQFVSACGSEDFLLSAVARLVGNYPFKERVWDDHWH